MVKLAAILKSGSTVTLPSPVSLELVAAEDSLRERVEADFLDLTELPAFEEITGVEAKVEDELIFSGDIYETTSFRSKGRRTARLSFRNTAFRMNQSEALPKTYQNPTCAEIWNNHAQAYGCFGYYQLEREVSGTYSVSKGTTDWKAVRDFYSLFHGTQPRITPGGILLTTDILSGKAVKLKTKNILGVSKTVGRMSEISEVAVRFGNGDYSYLVENKNASGLNRRCLSYQYETPVASINAEYILKVSRGKASSSEIISDAYLGNIGDRLEDLSFAEDMPEPAVISEISVAYENGRCRWRTTVRKWQEKEYE